jgi:signal transduction histidine kinase
MSERHDDVAEEDFPAAAVLIVDDHRPNLLAMQVILEPLGHELVLADSARAALELAARREFAVILSDVRMPDLDGFDLVARVREMTRTPVVMVSAVYDDRETVRRAYALGAVDFIAKPFDPDLVRWRVGALVSLYRRGQELKRRAELIARKEREAATAQVAVTRAVAMAEEAERKLEHKDKVVGILGHDLRNPLSTVLLAFQTLQRINLERDGVDVLLERGVQAGERMQAMIQDILDFARSAAGAPFPVRPRPADLCAVATMVVDEIRSSHPARSILIEMPSRLEILCDPDRIAQAMGNLVVNAIQHGQGPVSVRVCIDAGRVVLRVHNQGDPISEDDLPNLFEPFKRANRKSEGLGLGLHIVREIMRAHGGAVTVRSSRTDGTTFEASWPESQSSQPASSDSDERPLA